MVVSEPAVRVRIVDDSGALLLLADATPTRAATSAADDDVLQRILRGRELPRTGPTTVPTLHALQALPEPEAPPEVPVRLVDGPDEPVDAPSGSALAAVDMRSLFGISNMVPVARGRHAR